MTSETTAKAEPCTVAVATIMQMVRAFPGMAQATAARLLAEADQAAAAETLGVFLAETGLRYRVVKLAHRDYEVRPEADR